MIEGLLTWHKESLEDPVTGVNTTRLEVPREWDTTAPPSVQVYSENDCAWLARLQVPREILSNGPVLMLRQPEEFESPFLPENPEPGIVSIATLIATQGDATHTELRRMRQLLRAALRSYSLALNALAGADPQIRRAGCTYTPTGRVTWLPALVSTDTPLMAGLVTSFRVDDPWALGGQPDDDH